MEKILDKTVFFITEILAAIIFFLIVTPAGFIIRFTNKVYKKKINNELSYWIIKK